jgi:ribosomal protein S1
MYYSSVPTLVIRADTLCLASVNGRIVGECSRVSHVSIPISDTGDYYIGVAPLEGDWRTVTRKLAFECGMLAQQPAPDVSVCVWPGAVYEVMLFTGAYVEEELPETARHTSDMERRADDAERELVQWKKVRFMADKVGDEFDGYITGVAPFGLFVELVEHFVEGLVHVSTMADDYYRYLEATHTLRGENTEKTYRLGDRVRVQVLRVDMERRQIELGVVQILDAVRHEESRRQRRGASRPGKRERQERKGAGSRAAEPRRTRGKSSRRRGRR